MLVLTRRIGEEIILSGNIRISVVALAGERVRIGVTATRATRIDRAEVKARRLKNCAIANAESSECDPVPEVALS